MVDCTKPIAESNNFIILDKYNPDWKITESYQSEGDLERELIQDLVNCGYEYLPTLNNTKAMLANVREQLQNLNNVEFTEAEWRRFVETRMDKPSDGVVEKARKIHDDYVHDFVFDDGRIQNIYLLDRKTSFAIKCRSSSSLNKQARTPIATMSPFWSMACRWYKLN